MIWRHREDRLEDEKGQPHLWFAWRPIRVCVYMDPKGGDYRWVHVWWQNVLRQRRAGEWKYGLVEGDAEEFRMKTEAIHLAPKYAKEIILMSKTGG